MAFSSLLFPYQEVRISSQIMSLVPVPTDCTGNVTRPKRPKECRIPYRRERCPRLSARQTVRRTDEGCPSLLLLPHALLTQPLVLCECTCQHRLKKRAEADNTVLLLQLTQAPPQISLVNHVPPARNRTAPYRLGGEVHGKMQVPVYLDEIL